MATRLVSLVSKGRILGRLGNPAAKQQKRGAISHGPDIFAKGHDKFWSDYENYYRKVCALGFIFWPLSVFISLELDEVMEATREDFVPYVHMRIRTKPLPYGDGVRSLLHDPYFNATPGEGYDTDYNPHAHHHDDH